MELMDLLEVRITSLVEELQRLRMENQRLGALPAEALVVARGLEDENRALTALLAQERHVKDEVLARIDSLLERLKDIDKNA